MKTNQQQVTLSLIFAALLIGVLSSWFMFNSYDYFFYWTFLLLMCFFYLPAFSICYLRIKKGKELDVLYKLIKGATIFWISVCVLFILAYVYLNDYFLSWADAPFYTDIYIFVRVYLLSFDFWKDIIIINWLYLLDILILTIAIKLEKKDSPK